MQQHACRADKTSELVKQGTGPPLRHAAGGTRRTNSKQPRFWRAGKNGKTRARSRRAAPPSPLPSRRMAPEEGRAQGGPNQWQRLWPPRRRLPGELRSPHTRVQAKLQSGLRAGSTRKGRATRIHCSPFRMARALGSRLPPSGGPGSRGRQPAPQRCAHRSVVGALTPTSFKKPLRRLRWRLPGAFTGAEAAAAPKSKCRKKRARADGGSSIATCQLPLSCIALAASYTPIKMCQLASGGDGSGRPGIRRTRWHSDAKPGPPLLPPSPPMPSSLRSSEGPSPAPTAAGCR